MWSSQIVALLLVLTTYSALADELSDSLSFVSKECKSKLLNINSIEKFKSFIVHYRLVTGSTEKPKRGLLNTESGLRKCFDQKEMLLELDWLISNQGDGVCRLEYINKLIDFHLRYVIKADKESKDANKDLANSQGSLKKTYTAYVFSLFAHQIAFTCKSKLLERVSLLESQNIQCSDVLESFLPVKIATRDAPEDGIRAMFDDFLRNFKRVEDFSLMFSNMVNPYFNVIATPESGLKIHKLKEQCKTLEPYYKALFLPVSSLSQLGYAVDDTSVDSHDLNSPELRKLKFWLATAQMCQGVLRIHVKTLNSEEASQDGSTDNQFVEIKFDQPPSDVEQTEKENLPDVLRFADFVEEISSAIVQLVDKKKSTANRFKRTLELAKRLLVNHVKVDPSQNKMAGHFVSTLTRGENDLDSAVAFNGKYDNPGLYSPSRLVADDTDTIFAISSFFVNPTTSLILNSCVAIGLTAAFVVFTVSAAAFGVKKSMVNEQNAANGNFKEYFRTKLDERMKAANETHQRKGLAQKVFGEVYVGKAQ